MSFKKWVKNNKYLNPLYIRLKNLKDEKELARRLSYNGIFEDRSKGKKKLCLMLAGYKPYLYEYVFGRMKEYLDNDIDVCIITSGLYSSDIKQMCEDNEWSYLSTRENNVSLVQNVAISKHPKAEVIFKLDEDILITKGYFSKLYKAYEHCLESKFKPGIVAPILPINGFSHYMILEKYGLLKEYEELFEKPMCITLPDRKIENDPNVAKFFWGEGGYVPHIDLMNITFENDTVTEVVCPIKFSIGAILMPRTTWEDMGYFSVNLKQTALGADERELCSFCLLHSRPIMVSKNIVVGHFSFGKQTQGMIEYLKVHPEMFRISE